MTRTLVSLGHETPLASSEITSWCPLGCAEDIAKMYNAPQKKKDVKNWLGVGIELQVVFIMQYVMHNVLCEYKGP